MVVLRSMSLVATPPRVSMLRDSGVTSSSRMSLTSPARTAPWMAAPIDTHSMGSIPRWTFLPTTDSTNRCMMGMRVGPPTMMMLSTWSAVRAASLRAFCMGPLQRSTVGLTSSSSFARVMDMVRCRGPFWSAVMKGRLISVFMVEDSSILAFSHASFTRHMAILSLVRSMPVSFLNCAVA